MKSKTINLGIKEERELLKSAKKAIKANEIGKKASSESNRSAKRIVSNNLRFVKYIARGDSLYSGVDYEDLVTAGVISLTKAIDKFDLSVEGRFTTYAGYWIRQHCKTSREKGKIRFTKAEMELPLSQRKKVIFYDIGANREKDDRSSYSMIDTLSDEDNETSRAIDQEDKKYRVNNIINNLKSTESILIVRIIHKIPISNLFDLYCLASEKEKDIIKEKFKLNKKNPDILKNYNLEDEKKYKKIKDVLEKYKKILSKTYKFSELAKIVGVSENAARKLKKKSLEELRKIAKEEEETSKK